MQPNRILTAENWML